MASNPIVRLRLRISKSKGGGGVSGNFFATLPLQHFFYKIAQFLPSIAQYQLFLVMFCLFLVNGYSPLIRRCDKLLFMSTEADDDLGAVALQNISSGRASLWNKTRAVSAI